MTRRKMAEERDGSTLAAVDLGSNSFHLVIGRVVERHVRALDRVREPVCLAAGLDETGRLSDEAVQRAVACLRRMRERLRGIPPDRVRAVATNTLRRASNAAEVRARCATALGHPIEIVSGTEEARLIYLGVAASRFSPAPRLVADIGGGSTEIILGEGFDILRAHSLYMGCVDYTRRFFPGGALSKEYFRNAEIAARLELTTIAPELTALGWENAVGASGTIQAVAEILRANGWSQGQITPAGLKALRRAMIDAGGIGNLAIPGLRSDRAPVLPGGLAILRAIFKSLALESLEASDGALREGVLWDLLGRIRHEDARDRTVAAMVGRYHVDLDHAARVGRTALRLARQVEVATEPDDSEVLRLLTWSARLHEIGLAVSHTGFHKHGAYLLTYGEMAGFSADEQRLLAALVRGHRRRVTRSLFADVPKPRVELALRLCLLLRLAVLLNRGRVPQRLPRIKTDAAWSRIDLRFPSGWTAKHPLTAADLELEASRLAAIAVTLRVTEQRKAKKKKKGAVA